MKDAKDLCIPAASGMAKANLSRSASAKSVMAKMHGIIEAAKEKSV
jgi:hypothetical protein